jgi:hypothetical protein
MGMDAQTPEDRMASAILKNAAENWRADLFENHLTPDSDPGAMEAIRAANAAHRDRMERFGYNYARQPGEIRSAQQKLNQIVTGGLGPEQLRTDLIDTKPGARPVTSPLYEAIANAHPDAAAFRNQMRGAYWNDMNAKDARGVARVAQKLAPIGDQPSRIGAHLFDPSEHSLIHQVARSRLETPEAISEINRAKPPRPVEAIAGEAERFVKSELGRKADAEVYQKFDAGLKEGGDIRTSSRMWRGMTDENRDAARGAWIRGMGGGTGDTFSLLEFVKNWENYSKDAKTMMLGPENSEHRQNLQRFYEDAKKYTGDLKRFGNPSGTGPYNAWVKLLTGVGGLAVGGAFGHLFLAAAAGLGAWKLAKIMAMPAGAQQMARWSRLAKAYQMTPHPRTLNALQTATRILNDMPSTPASPKKAAETDESLPRRAMAATATALRRSEPIQPTVVKNPVTIGIRG